MRLILLSSLLTFGGLVACAPTAVVSDANVTVTPVLFKTSEAVRRGGSVTLQGRYLGGPSTGTIIMGAQSDGSNGYAIPASAIQSWTDNQIVFTVPSNAPAGGSWLFVKVANMLSTGLPVSVQQ